jgi:hypothetical protein
MVEEAKKQILTTLEEQNNALRDHQQFSTAVGTAFGDLIDATRTRKILQNLHFEVIKDREAKIKEAHEYTLDWIFSDNAGPTRPRSPFSKWLRSGHGVF